MSGKKWKLRQDGRQHYALLEDADVPANVHRPPIAFLSFVEQEHRDLIVAAPEMLDALKDAIEVLTGIAADDDAHAYSVALTVHAAIAKAEVREP
jgi:hypothetical protein